MRVLDEDDEFKVVVLAEVVRRAHIIEADAREDLAARIAHGVSKVLGGG
jgi:hypothetical protein